jgi:ComF family protein
MATSLLKNFAARALDVLWPRHCFGCGRPLAIGAFYVHLCDRCVGDLNFVFLGDGCDIFFGEELFSSRRSLFEFNGLGRQLIHEIKYRSGRFLLNDIGRISRIPFGDMADSILVPVPIHWVRRLRRGFNQSDLICRTLSTEHGCSVCRMLRRNRYNRPQVGLSRSERLRNVAGAFSMAPRFMWKGIAKDAKICLVDDVLTTGATASECAKVLLREGFCNIHVRTLAHG